MYLISDRYIEYLSKENPHVMSNKVENRTYHRKYIGLITKLGGFTYFVPLSSPKPRDFIREPKTIKKDSLTTIYIRQNEKLFGTIKFNNMIPVPKSELTEYRLNDEGDLKYKIVVWHEFLFIKQNRAKIEKTAKNLYEKKIASLAGSGDQNPLLKLTLDFPQLEKLCLEFPASLAE